MLKCYLFILFPSSSCVPRPTLNKPPPGRVSSDCGICLLFLSKGYEGSDLGEILKEIEASDLVLMDRWSIQVIPNDPQEAGDPVPYEIINNYFSIGVVSCYVCREERWHHTWLLIDFWFKKKKKQKSDKIRNPCFCVHVSRMHRLLIVSTPWEKNTPRDSTAGEDHA